MNDKIKKLRNYAKERGLKIIFRNTKTAAGDFCIFIYDKQRQIYRSRYLVGYDGYNNNSPSLDECILSAYTYINAYLNDLYTNKF